MKSISKRNLIGYVAIISVIILLIIGELCLFALFERNDYSAYEGTDAAWPEGDMVNDITSGVSNGRPANSEFMQILNKGDSPNVPMGTESDSSSSVGGEVASSGRKLLRRADITVETTEYDDYVTWLEEQVSDLGGYFEQQSSYNRDSGYLDSECRTLNATIRVPATQLDVLLDSMAVNGNVTSHSESQVDVTEGYVDTEAHLYSLRTEQERLNELLSVAETVEDIISIEDRLSYVRYEIESYERQLRSYDSQIEYSVVTMTVSEVIEYTEPEPEGFFARCANAFVENVEWLGLFLQGVAVFIIGHIPAIALGAVIGVAVFQVVKWSRRKRGVVNKAVSNEGAK